VPDLLRISGERNHYAVNGRICQSMPFIFTLTSIKEGQTCKYSVERCQDM
jgi:hypothetical protein